MAVSVSSDRKQSLHKELVARTGKKVYVEYDQRKLAYLVQVEDTILDPRYSSMERIKNLAEDSLDSLADLRYTTLSHSLEQSGGVIDRCIVDDGEVWVVTWKQ